MTIRRKISIAILLIFAVIAGVFSLYNQIYFSTGSASEQKTVLVEKGDNVLKVSAKLAEAGVLKNKYYLVYYLWKNNQAHSLVAGVYLFQPGVKVPEVARIVTGGENVPNRVPITFPEGWTAKDMAERLDANGFSGSDFLAIVNNPSADLKNKYDFLRNLKDGQTLEGYLFPDTYYFNKDANEQDIVEKMLKNFDAKVDPAMLAEITNQKKSLRDVMIMASIIEKEARFPSDMKIVGSVFYNRLAAGQRLQSDATLEYVLADNKIKHSTEDLQNASPYNTYRYEGLPPGPVSNPGSAAIDAAVHPAQTDYFYFLTDLATHKTIFAKTFDEHVANKAKYGL